MSAVPFLGKLVLSEADGLGLTSRRDQNSCSDADAESLFAQDLCIETTCQTERSRGVTSMEPRNDMRQNG